MQTKYMAIGRNNVTGPACDSPRTAAREFFARYPMKRTCSIVEGNDNGKSPPKSVPLKHRYWRDITPKQIDTMFPDN